MGFRSGFYNGTSILIVFCEIYEGMLRIIVLLKNTVGTNFVWAPNACTFYINKHSVNLAPSFAFFIYLFLDKILIPCFGLQALDFLLLLFCLFYVQYLFLSQPTKHTKKTKEWSWTAGILLQKVATYLSSAAILFEDPSHQIGQHLAYIVVFAKWIQPGWYVGHQFL